ncbi:MAG: NAD(P)-dependent oxidoreductase, partial [Pseudomonadota bacterium]
LSGIYGPGRNALKTASEGRSRRLVKKDQVFNRIHNHDIAVAVDAAIAGNIGGIFNITDDEPSPPQDVVTFAHVLLGTEPPPEVDFETAELSPMARSFYGENKRVSNAKSKQVLGMDYAYSNYRVALTRMFEEDTWRAAQHG